MEDIAKFNFSNGKDRSTVFFTIFVPTYNRAHTLPRALSSIEAQSYKQFEVIVVDDGSTDNTREIIADWASKVSQPVTYIYQQNRGKHVAHNTALAYASGYLTVILDSDDKLVPNALERMKHHWDSIPDKLKEQYSGVEGRVATFEGKPEPKPFPTDIMDSDFIETRYNLGIRGDKKGAIRTDLLKNFPYPEFPGEKHVRPSLLFKRLAKNHKTRYVNEVYQLVERQPSGLSADRFTLRVSNPLGFQFYYAEDVKIHIKTTSFKNKLRSYTQYIRYSLHCGIGFVEQIQFVPDRVYWLLALFPGTIKWLRDRIKKRSYLLGKTDILHH